jgi:hypothetical protein
VEEIGTPEMVITLGIERIDILGLGIDFHNTAGKCLIIDFQGAREIVKTAINISDPQMLNPKYR